MISLLVALALAQPSSAFVRSRVKQSEQCLWWPAGTNITWHPNSTGNPVTTGNTEIDALTKAFASWRRVTDGCSSLTLTDGAPTSSRKIGWIPSSLSNENVLLFRLKSCSTTVGASDGCWKEGTCANLYDCWDQQAAALAITTTSYDGESGQIHDSDVEFNAQSFYFTANDGSACTQSTLSQNCVAFDVQNTATHEIGHMLGLDHTSAPNSTMNPTAPLGETAKRVVDTGTQSFVCDVYAKGKPAKTCVVYAATPVAGYEAQGCSSAPGLSPLLGLLLAARGLRRS